MKNTSNKRRVLKTLLASAALLACTRPDAKRADETSPVQDSRPSARAESAALVAQVGIEPGPVQQTGAPGALLVRAKGDVQVRRLGEEAFAPAKQGDALFLGDQVRAAEGAGATVMFPDESTAELAEVSTLAIGSRVATADPASSAAVLSGVARFSVSARAPGEGPFLVFSPAGVVATKGTVFGVGVAAAGDARVGVESGAVDVAGAAALDAPLSVEANGAIALSAMGKLSAPVPWPQDDWGLWRGRAETNIDVASVTALHTQTMADLAVELDTTYGALANLGAEVASFEVSAAAQASSNDSAGYTARQPDAALAIEASFMAALRLEYLTHAYLSHAVLASELYVRHPKLVVWTTLEPRVQAAVLWPKRFDVMAAAYLEPLRLQYYLHHPRGRAHAQWIGVSVPSFYARVTAPEVPSVDVKTKLKFKSFAPPKLKFTATARPVWIGAPSAKWHEKALFKASPARGKLTFWVRPPQLEGKAILGTSVNTEISPAFGLRAPLPRGQLKHSWSASFGHKVKLPPPDVQAATAARAGWRLDAEAPSLSADLKVKEAPSSKAKLSGRASAVRVAKLDAKAQSASKARALARTKLNADASASAKLKVKPPEVKAPKLKAEARAGGSFKFGT